MPSKKTETKSEGAAAAKPKSSGSQHTYQDMITDAIVAVFHPVPLPPAHLGRSVAHRT
jgi:hypothetical protein